VAQAEPFAGALAGHTSIEVPPAPVVPVVPELPPAPVDVDVPVLPEDMVPVVIPSEPAVFPVPSPVTAPPQPGTIADASVATVIKKGGRSGRFLREVRCAMAHRLQQRTCQRFSSKAP
jgi:hypothetical protein